MEQRIPVSVGVWFTVFAVAYLLVAGFLINHVACVWR